MGDKWEYSILEWKISPVEMVLLNYHSMALEVSAKDKLSFVPDKMREDNHVRKLHSKNFTRIFWSRIEIFSRVRYKNAFCASSSL